MLDLVELVVELAVELLVDNHFVLTNAGCTAPPCASANDGCTTANSQLHAHDDTSHSSRLAANAVGRKPSRGQRPWNQNSVQLQLYPAPVPMTWIIQKQLSDVAVNNFPRFFFCSLRDATILIVFNFHIIAAVSLRFHIIAAELLNRLAIAVARLRHAVLVIV